MGLKDLFKQRIPIHILSGGQALTKGNGGVQSANIMKGKEQGEIIAKVPFGGGDYTFRFTSIEWEQSHERSAGKAAAGAIAGKMVGGTAGAIAGAAVGGKKKDTSKAFMYVTDPEGNEHEWHIKCDETMYRQLSALVG
jgi:hypothetical protein